MKRADPARRPRRPRPRAVRFGGRDSPRGWLFELSGGHPALDFVNTLDERRSAEPQERLRDFRDLAGFARQARLVEEGPGRELARAFARDAAAALRCVRSARALREHLFELFSAAVDRAPLPQAALRALNSTLARAGARRRLEPAPGGARWVISAEGAPQAALLSTLALSAADLLASPDLKRIRRCAGRGCAWLFLDQTRNGSRRWCDMTVCGNRSKVARHRERLRAR